MAERKLELIIEAQNFATKEIQRIEKQIKKMSSRIKRDKSFSRFGKNAQKNIGQIKLALAGLWIWFWFFVKSSIKASTQLENSMLWLRSIVEWTWQSFTKSEKFLKEFTKDWLVPVSEAATSLKNLLSRWFNMDESVTIMNRFKDSAAFWKQASLELWEAIRWATEWLKNENSVLVDNAWVTKNVSMMWKDYADKIWVGVNSLSLAQKRQAELNWIIQETRFQVGDAAKLTETAAGKQAMLTARTLELKQALWKALTPALAWILQSIQPVVEEITNWINKNPEAIVNFANKVGSAIQWAIIILKDFIINWKIVIEVIKDWANQNPLLASVAKAIWLVWGALLLLNANPIFAIITAWVLLVSKWQWVKDNVGKAIFDLIQYITNLKNNFKEMITSNTNKFREWVFWIWENINQIKNVFISWFNSIKDFILWIFDKIVWWVTSKIQWLIDFVSSAVEKVTWAYNKIVNFKRKVSKMAWDTSWVRWWVVSWIWGAMDKIAGRAWWWQVNKNEPYIIWEKWPEMFVPNSNGSIIPNNNLWWEISININLWWVNNINTWADETSLVEKIKTELTRTVQLQKLWITN